MKPFVLFIILSWTIQVSAQSTLQGESWAVERIDDHLTRSVENGFSGALIIASKNKVVLKKGYGQAEHNQSSLITPATLFDIGSVTKQFTAALVVKLQSEGKLSVQDTLARYFAKVPEDKQSITLHQLLTHSSGLPGGIGVSDFDPISTEVFFETVLSTPLIDKPGASFHYSNVGYSVLARIIEKVTSMTYESALRKYLLLPAGMEHTGYLQLNTDQQQVAPGYKAGVLRVQPNLAHYRQHGRVSWALKGNGGLVSSVEDMYLWYQALQNHTVISAAQWDELSHPYVLANAKFQEHYGYGWSLYRAPDGGQLITHNGSDGVFYFDFRWQPEQQQVIIFASNALMQPTPALSENIELMLADNTFNPPAFEPGPITRVLRFALNYSSSPQALKKALIRQFSQVMEERVVLNRAGLALSDAGYHKKAIVLLELNTEQFSDDGNLWDSLGEAQLKDSQLEAAKHSFANALALAPDKRCYWCANARKKLEHIKLRQKAATPVTSGSAG